MSFIDKLSARLPFGKKEEKLEYYFTLNIGAEKLTAALWTIEGYQLRILESASENYSSNDEITSITDRLLDQALGLKEIEPQKILFGVPTSWLADENLKDEYLKLLRSLVKELELTPMAYVALSHALIHFLERQEGVPTTAILVGFEEHHLTITVVRAGKLDGVKIISRGENSGSDIEKVLLSFADVETLPSKILIYGQRVSGLKNQLLSFSWMSKLSFLHFPKIDVLEEDIEIKSVCLAGASEIQENVSYSEHLIKQVPTKSVLITPTAQNEYEAEIEKKVEVGGNFGFMVGDVSKQVKKEEEEEELALPKESNLLEVNDPEQKIVSPAPPKEEKKLSLKKFIIPLTSLFVSKRFVNLPIILGIVSLIVILLAALVFIPKADIKIFVEPKILEKDAQVVADPNQKTVDENAKIIPGQTVQTEVSGSAKDSASGRKQVGESAKGTIVIYNKTFDAKSLSKGTVVTSTSGFKFTLDTSVNIASQSASDTGITFGKVNTTVSATAIGADSNLSSSSELNVSGSSSSQVSAKAEGNFSGGTSKEVTVVSSEDQQKLMAKLSSDLRQKAQQKLQEKLPGKKILQEALSEQIVNKSYSKNINDQASEFSLNMTISYKGTAFDDADLRLIVSKLVTTQVPDNFLLDLSQTETQADVSKLEKDGKLIFLAKFKAKLIPKIATDKIKNQIKFKTPMQVAEQLKQIDNVLGSEIKITPSLPKILQRIPILGKNITIEVGLK